MTETAVFERVVKILTPYVKNQDALTRVSAETDILGDLQVNSARLVDVVLEFEDDFEIEIGDDDIDSVSTIGDCVKLIVSKAA